MYIQHEHHIELDGAMIPLDESNADYQAFLAWVQAGNTPEAATPVVAIPAAVTMRQARLALLAAGKLVDVSNAIAGLPSPQKEAAQIEWDYAATVERASPFVQQLAILIDLDEQALDGLFVAAAQL